MQTCEILVTTKDGQVVAGRVIREGDGFRVQAAKGHEILMKNIVKHPHLLDGGSKRVTAQSDPQAWFTSFPENYSGSYLRARLLP